MDGIPFTNDICDAKRRKLNVFVTLPGYHKLCAYEGMENRQVEFIEGVSMDKDDFGVVNAILAKTLGRTTEKRALNKEQQMLYNDRMQMIRNITKILADDEERRIWYLDLSRPLRRALLMPEEIGNLVYLKTLVIRWSGIKEIPSSIGHLKNLKELYLGTNRFLKKLPKEIGELINLIKLDLHYTLIDSLPPSIGRLQNLKILDLSWTTSLTELPKEIDKLVSLEKLDLRFTRLGALPCSIWELRSLKELNFGLHRSSKSLSPDVGKLINLEILDLGESSIESLPNSIVKLSKLKRLDLRQANITKLPEFIGRLSCLRSLYIYGTCVPKLTDDNNLEDFFLALLQRCRYLGELDYGLENGSETLALALERNRARTIFPFFATPVRPRTVQKLWPHMLQNAIRAFCRRPRFGEYGRERIGVYDAVHLLLTDGIDSFVELLQDRSSKNMGNRKGKCSSKYPASGVTIRRKAAEEEW